MKNKFKGTVFREPRRDRSVAEEYAHDNYKSRGKPREPTVCPGCGALFLRGRWTWGSRPEGAHEEICPACGRIEDKNPGGFLRLSGPFLKTHREEILNVARNEEEEAGKEHPLSRIMGIEESEEEIVITTTDTHLPRRIGETLKHAYGGEIHLHYEEDPRLIRVTWER